MKITNPENSFNFSRLFITKFITYKLGLPKLFWFCLRFCKGKFLRNLGFWNGKFWGGARRGGMHGADSQRRFHNAEVIKDIFKSFFHLKSLIMFKKATHYFNSWGKFLRNLGFWKVKVWYMFIIFKKNTCLLDILNWCGIFLVNLIFW